MTHHVLENYYLLSNILQNLDYMTLSRIMTTSKLFKEICKENNTNLFKLVSKAIGNLYTNYISERLANFGFTEHVRSFRFTSFIEKLISVENYGAMFLKNNYFTKTLFHTAAHFHGYRLVFIYSQYGVDMKYYNNIHDNFRRYLYMDTTSLNSYSTTTLKGLLYYRNPKQYVLKMKRKQLIRKLRTPCICKTR